MPGSDPQEIDFERGGDVHHRLDPQRTTAQAAFDSADHAEAEPGLFLEGGLRHLPNFPAEQNAGRNHAATTAGPRASDVGAEDKGWVLERLSHVTTPVCTCQLEGLAQMQQIHPTERIAWFLIVLFVTLGLAFALLGIHPAYGSTPTLTERLVTAQGLLASRRDEPVDAQELATSIATVTKGNRVWSAMILTVAGHESALSKRIADGNCNLKIGECDGGRAWGLFQVHKNDLNAEAWGSTDIDVQTREAARMLRSVFHMCNGHGALTPDWPARTLSAYAGRRCDERWPGLDKRVATFERLVRQL